MLQGLIFNHVNMWIWSEALELSHFLSLSLLFIVCSSKFWFASLYYCLFYFSSLKYSKSQDYPRFPLKTVFSFFATLCACIVDSKCLKACQKCLPLNMVLGVWDIEEIKKLTIGYFRFCNFFRGQLLKVLLGNFVTLIMFLHAVIKPHTRYSLICI